MAIAYIHGGSPSSAVTAVIRFAQSAAHCPANSLAFCERGTVEEVMAALGAPSDGNIWVVPGVAEADTEEDAFAAFMGWHHRSFPGEDYFRVYEVPRPQAELRAELQAELERAETALVCAEMTDNWKQREHKMREARARHARVEAAIAALEGAAQGGEAA